MSAVLVVIDPQKGFTAQEGTLGKAFGAGELARIASVVKELAQHLPVLAESAKTALVTSEYRPGQFDGDPNGSLSLLCVPGLSQDCAIDDALATFTFEQRFTKTEKSALSNAAFCHWILSEEDRGVRDFFLCGFLFEHCVLETAMDLKAALSPPSRVIVLSDLVASRASKYAANGVVEQSMRRLEEAGIEICAGDMLI